jgi:hypothetical protein
MARKKASQTRADQDVKISVNLPKELHDQIQQACARHGLSASLLIRKLIAGGIGAWLEAQGASAGALQQQGVATTVLVTSEIAQALDAVGGFMGLSRDAVAQVVLTENLAELGERARKWHEGLLRLPAPPTREEDEPEPA